MIEKLSEKLVCLSIDNNLVRIENKLIIKYGLSQLFFSMINFFLLLSSRI